MNEPSREKQLESILHGYLQAVDAGQHPDREELLRKHPDLADDLREFFRDQAKVDQLAQSLQQAHVADVTIGAEEAAGNVNGLPCIRYFGDYELLEEIARGGMGVVYKARQVSLNRVVALKMILAGQLASPAEVLRFRAEAEAAANLDHPNIVPIYEIGDHEGQHYFSMKLIEGGNLARQVPSLLNNPRVAIKALIGVARAVHHAHQRGILHRDLKPANILLDAKGEPLVSDFGLAKLMEGGSDITRSGAIVGTPSYMAPEQATAQKGLSTAVDVYSLGAILFELLTGRPPFRAETPLQTLVNVVEDEPDRPSSVKGGVDHDLETICLKCLQKEPQKRYGTAEALADDLERWQTGKPILARPVGRFERTMKWAKRRPVVTGLLAAVVLVTMLGGIAFGWAFNRALVARNDAVDKEKEARDHERIAKKNEVDAKIERENAIEQTRLTRAQWQRGERPGPLATAVLRLTDFIRPARMGG